MAWSSDEIREAFLAFFAQRDHKRLPSAPLIPQDYDPSVLLTTAGMHPLKPYFLGQERPPHVRLTSAQKCFRTTDIENVGNTARHLTLFEMLGNFSIGDYFKEGAIELAWELSLDVFGLDGDAIWITVFEGDAQLGLGPDEEAIAAWQAVGIPRERIVACPRSENFWQAGPTGPCGPCSELYFDRGLDYGSADDLPGGDNERFLEYWNLVFMQYDQAPENALSELPSRNIDTGLGLDRLAAILQDVPSVFETDLFRPLVELGEELSGRRYAEDFETTRALRVLADHSRAMTFLIADGVVPSNEDRGYILRRVMRRAIQQGRTLGLEPGYLPAFAQRVRELMSGAYPELEEQRDAIDQWLRAEEESFGRTLETGLQILEQQHIPRAKDTNRDHILAADAFELHDTFGFPIELTTEIAADHGLGVEMAGFDDLMGEQRARARAAAGGGRAGDGGDERQRARALAAAVPRATEFTGYETLEQETTVAAIARENGRALVKLDESPFYAAGGGQVSDAGVVECEGGECRARVADVIRLGDDQALVLELERGVPELGERVIARVDGHARHATACNHTATHLLHAALRERLGAHVRQAGSAVQPDKLRFDFSHGSALSAGELADIENRVNEWILANDPVRAITTTLDEAKKLGAMALFGEKYGDIVRMVQIGDGHFSRELCGGTHVRSTAEIGVFRLVSESSSAANVRRIEAVTGPVAVDLLRRHDALLGEVAAKLRVGPEQALDALSARELRLAELERAPKEGGGGGAAPALEELERQAVELDGVRVLAAVVDGIDQKGLLELVDRLKGRLGDAAIVLGSATGGRVALVASVAPALVERGVRAGDVVRVAAELTGGGGGGRDTLARAGGRYPERLDAALAAASAAIESALS